MDVIAKAGHSTLFSDPANSIEYTSNVEITYPFSALYKALSIWILPRFDMIALTVLRGEDGNYTLHLADNPFDKVTVHVTGDDWRAWDIEMYVGELVEKLEQINAAQSRRAAEWKGNCDDEDFPQDAG